MKKITKIKFIVLITFGIMIPTIISFKPNFIFGNMYEGSDYRNDFNINLENLRVSKLSDKIHIIGNPGWVDFKNAGNCIGTGISSDPYIIEDLIIDSGGPGSSIVIENSNVYFKIENCTIYNSGTTIVADGGIKLVNVKNGEITNNNCSSIYKGIYVKNSEDLLISGNNLNENVDNGIHLFYCMKITVSGNTVNNNGNDGIYIHDNSNNNTVSGNTVDSNDDDGIYIIYGNDNIVSGNIISNNGDVGIFLRGSNTNRVSGNTFSGNEECITEEDCQGNEFTDNDSCDYGEGDTSPAIPGYNLFFLIGTLSALSFIILKKIKRSSKLI